AAGITRLRDRERGVRPSVVIASTMYALGPAVVFFCAGSVTPRAADWPVYVAAAAAQFVCDAFAAWYLNCFRLGGRARALAPALLFAYAIDALLFPVGYAIALAAPRSVKGLLLFVPVLLLLVVLSRDRRRNLDRAIALATHDALTGLPNRTTFNERVA